MLAIVIMTVEIAIIIASVIWSYCKIKNLQKTIPEGYYMETVDEWLKNLQEIKEFSDKQ